MYAVIKAGGHQYRVAAGDKLRLEKMAGAPGDAIEFDQVMMVGHSPEGSSDGEGCRIGTPYVANATVEAIITAHGRDPKVTVFKFKRRKNYKKKRGHKQLITMVEIKKLHLASVAPASGVSTPSQGAEAETEA